MMAPVFRMPDWRTVKGALSTSRQLYSTVGLRWQRRLIYVHERHIWRRPLRWTNSNNFRGSREVLYCSGHIRDMYVKAWMLSSMHTLLQFVSNRAKVQVQFNSFMYDNIGCSSVAPCETYLVRLFGYKRTAPPPSLQKNTKNCSIQFFASTIQVLFVVQHWNTSCLREYIHRSSHAHSQILSHTHTLTRTHIHAFIHSFAFLFLSCLPSPVTSECLHFLTYIPTEAR